MDVVENRVQEVSVGLPTAFKYKEAKFYVRECYETYYELVIKFLEQYDYISVTGTPGLYFNTNGRRKEKAKSLSLQA